MAPIAAETTWPLPDDTFAALKQAAARHGDRDFVVLDHRAQAATYEAMLGHATRLAALLDGRGVRAGDRVCLAMANSVDWAAAAFAAWALGAVIVPLSTRLVDREVRHCLDLARPRAVIMHEHVRRRALLAEWPSLAGHMSEGTDVLVHDAPSPGSRWSLPRPLSAGTPRPALPWPRAGGPGGPGLEGAAALLFTSGTTAAPKGVILTHRGLLRLSREVGRRQGVGPADKFFSVAPFFHCSGLMHALLTTLMGGATLFAASRYMPEDALRVMSEQGVTVAHGPLPSPREIAAAGWESPSFPRFTRAWSGGTPQELTAKENVLGIRICSLWGMTETGGCHALTRSGDPAEVRHASAGEPMPGLEFRIGDDRDAGPGPDGAGELHVRGWNITPGYYRDPAATAAAIDDGGWLRTGDLARRLPDGRLQFIGRIKDLIRVGGENLAPAEVEMVLAAAEHIADAAVVPWPDERLGEVPVAVIVTAPGTAAAAVTADTLRRHCASMLAGFKVPRQFFVVDSIPRTHATGRVQRHRIQADISSGRVTHVN
jgi:acyl-CoA synthetase (AMP-forming)/AMP-acid ligase II